MGTQERTNDSTKKLLATKKEQTLEPFLSVATGRKLTESFRESFVIGSDDIWQVFNYISENSSVVIEKMSEENIIPTRWQDHKVFGIRITKKSDLND